MEPWQGTREPRKWQREALPVVLESMKRKVPGIVSAVMGSGKSVLASELCWLALPKLGERAVVVSAPRQHLVNQLAATISERCVGKVGKFYADEKEPDAPVIVTCNASMPTLRVALGERSRRVALMVVDEAHSSEGEVLHDEIPALNPVCLCGFTATPFRSIPKESLSLFREIVYRYSMADALRDGVLVPMRHVRYRGSSPGSVDEECLSMMQEHGVGPGIVSADSINDAERFSDWLTEHGFVSMPIHSRMNGWERARRLEALQFGGVRCLVHVSLLAEGVDLPWLKWLCLRRKVQARVRFLQEIGRVLRVHPGKDEGVVMDPHLLLGRHGLVSAEAIGVAMEQAALALEKEPEVRDERGLTEDQVIALDALTEYLADLRESMERAELVGPRWTSPDGDGWRLVGVSEKQVDRLGQVRKLTRHIPKEYREPVKALVRVPWALTRGQAGDLLDVLLAGSKYAKENARSWQEPFMVQWDADEIESVGTPSSAYVRAVGKIKVVDE